MSAIERLQSFWRTIVARLRKLFGKEKKRKSLADRVVVTPKSATSGESGRFGRMLAVGKGKILESVERGPLVVPEASLNWHFVPAEESMLIGCAKAGDAERLAKLLDSGADVNEQDRQGMTALHHAAALGARACVRLLVSTGACDYLIRDKAGRTAAELALEWSADPAVAILLSKKEAKQRPATEPQRLM